MSTPALCGVCSQQPSKYKCPTCQLPYCSLACYKPHKASHSSLNPSTVLSDPSQASASIADTTASSAPRPAPPQPPPRPQANPKDLLTSTAIRTLLATNPKLLTHLRAIYTSTLDPSNPVSTYNDTTTSSSDTNRHHPYHSRGRGRGHFRGRGRGNFHASNDRQKAPWTQERADEVATGMIKKLRAEEGDESKAMEDFVKMVKDIMGGVDVAGGEVDTQGEERDVDVVAVLGRGVTERARQEGRVMVEEVEE